MAEFPALPLFTDAFIADTAHLTAQQTGAYLLLLMAAWRTSDCRLPDDDKILARYCRLDSRAWRSNKDIIMSFWKKDDGGKWYQSRLVDERNFVASRRQKNVAAGKASALKRHDTRSTTVIGTLQRNSNPLNPNPKGSTNGESPLASTAVPRTPPEKCAPDVFELGQKIASITGWLDDPNWMGNYSRLAAWLKTGWDFEQDILPTVRKLMAKRTTPPNTLIYFERAIADAHAARLQPIPKGTDNGPKPINHGNPPRRNIAQEARAAALAGLEA